jgi:hypothetical protein
MAGLNRIIDVQTFPGLSKAEDQCDPCEGDAAQAGLSPYWENVGILFLRA